MGIPLGAIAVAWIKAILCPYTTLLQFTKVTTDVFAAVTYGRTMVLAGGGSTVETRT
jgi:hypothetical protein